MSKPTVIDPLEAASIRTLNISYDSIYDGPGSRVVVFFQGCAANCYWCHSPHSQPKFSPLLFNEIHCVYCGRCQAVCKQNVHLVENEQHNVNRESCIQCGQCVEACPNSFLYRQAGALHLPTKKSTVPELFQQLRPHLNLVKYDGGITLSGGEALLQKKAAIDLLKLCKQNSVSTAVETSGLLPVKYYQDLDGLVDYWLFGLRFTTNYPLKQHTKTVIQSFETIEQYDSKILPRIPVVPGHTDSDWYLQTCTEFLQKKQIQTVFINPWNKSTDHYYRLGGIDNPMSPPSTELATESEKKIIKYLQQKNINVTQTNYL